MVTPSFRRGDYVGRHRRLPGLHGRILFTREGGRFAYHNGVARWYDGVSPRG